VSTRWTIESHDIVTSTMDLALDRARAGGPDGLVVVAAEQTSGRGRRGNRWESPRGGLWFSVVIGPGDAAAPELMVAASLASAAACSMVTGINVQVKWPNDLYVADAKVGGVMGETAGDAVVLGIGINANVTEEFIPSVEYYRVTSLSIEARATVELPALLDGFLVELESRVAALAGGGLRALLPEWRSRSAELGRGVIAFRGGERLAGTAKEIREDGGLVVDVGGKSVILLPHGDVSLGLSSGAEQA